MTRSSSHPMWYENTNIFIYIQVINPLASSLQSTLAGDDHGTLKAERKTRRPVGAGGRSRPGRRPPPGRLLLPARVSNVPHDPGRGGDAPRQLPPTPPRPPPRLSAGHVRP